MKMIATVMILGFGFAYMGDCAYAQNKTPSENDLLGLMLEIEYAKQTAATYQLDSVESSLDVVQKQLGNRIIEGMRKNIQQEKDNQKLKKKK